VEVKKTMRIVLPLPISLNSMYSQSRSGHRFKTQEAKDWEEEFMLKLLISRVKPLGKAKIEVFISYYFKDNRSDLGNRTKILIDALQKSRFIDNDNQVWALHEYKEIDKKNPRCVLQVDVLEE